MTYYRGMEISPRYRTLNVESITQADATATSIVSGQWSCRLGLRPSTFLRRFEADWERIDEQWYHVGTRVMPVVPPPGRGSDAADGICRRPPTTPDRRRQRWRRTTSGTEQSPAAPRDCPESAWLARRPTRVVTGQAQPRPGASALPPLPSFIGGFRSGSTLLINLLGLRSAGRPLVRDKMPRRSPALAPRLNDPGVEAFERALIRSPESHATSTPSRCTGRMLHEMRATAARIGGAAPTGKAAYERYPIGTDCVAYSLADAEHAAGSMARGGSRRRLCRWGGRGDGQR